MDENKDLGFECLFNSLPVSLCFKLSPEIKGNRKGSGSREDKRCADVFLPNSDFVSEPEHTVCKDATRHGAAPFLPVGRLAL